GALARPGFPYHTQAFTGHDVQIHAVDRLHEPGLCRKMRLQPAYPQGGHGRRRVKLERRSHRTTSRGSKASRSPCAATFTASTSPNMATPGNVLTHHASSRCARPSATIDPHEASGGCIPSPRKDRLASRRMIVAMRVVATTMTGERMLGRISRHM